MKTKTKNIVKIAALIGIPYALTTALVLMLALKIGGVLAIHWLWVFSPLFLAIALFLAVCVLFFIEFIRRNLSRDEKKNVQPDAAATTGDSPSAQ